MPRKTVTAWPFSIDPLAGGAHEDDPAPRRCLITDQLVFMEPLFPEGAEAAVGRAGHRIIDAGGRGEKSGDKIVLEV